MKNSFTLKGPKIALVVQKLQQFYWRGGFCLLVELHWEGSAPAACTAGFFFKLTIMGTLQVRTKWNYQSWIQIFQIKFFFLVLSFWKRIAQVYFLRTDWSYTFLKVKNSNQNFNLKKSFETLEIWIFMG